MPTTLSDTADAVLNPVRRQVAAIPETVVAPAIRVIDSVSSGVRSFSDRLRAEPLKTVLPYAAAALAVAIAFTAATAIARRSR